MFTKLGDNPLFSETSCLCIFGVHFFLEDTLMKGSTDETKGVVERRVDCAAVRIVKDLSVSFLETFNDIVIATVRDLSKLSSYAHNL